MLPTLRRALSLTLLALSGCGENALAPREAIDSLLITSSSSALRTGSGMQLGLLVFGVSGQLINDEPRTWLSETPNVASVNATGYLVGLAAGVAIISATAGGKVARIAITVQTAGCTGANGDSVSIGGGVSSTLSVRPCALSGGYTAYGHILRVTEAGTIQADIRSSGFVPSLILTTITGGGRRTAQSANGSTAVLRASVLPGTYILWAATTGGVAPNNSYTVSVQTAAGECNNAPPGHLAVGEARSMTISTSSCVLLGGPVVEGWQLGIATTTRVRLVGASADFPPMVAITDDELELIAIEDVGAPGTAALTWVLPPGEYRVWAGSFFSGSGTIDVSLEEIEICSSMPTLQLGSALTASLAAGDCEYDRWVGRYADAYLLTLAAPTQLQIDLTSPEFDTYLFVTTLDGAELGKDDDSGEGLNSRLVITLPAGTFRVWASSYNRGATGTYTLLAAPATAGALRLERAARASLSSPVVKPEQPGWRPPLPRPRTF